MCLRTGGAAQGARPRSVTADAALNSRSGRLSTASDTALAAGSHQAASLAPAASAISSIDRMRSAGS